MAQLEDQVEELELVLAQEGLEQVVDMVLVQVVQLEALEVALAQDWDLVVLVLVQVVPALGLAEQVMGQVELELDWEEQEQDLEVIMSQQIKCSKNLSINKQGQIYNYHIMFQGMMPAPKPVNMVRIIEELCNCTIIV